MIFPPFHLVKAGLGRLRRPAFDARASVELTRFNLPFFPASRYALAPSALLTVLNDVTANQRRTILELGSGYSSVYIAKALQMQDVDDGVVITVDAHEEWLAKVIDKAREAGVSDHIRAVHAPLIDLPEGDGVWYDQNAIRTALAGRDIELLLVDGPVASSNEQRFARRPAVPMLKDALAARCAIYLDDVHRTSHGEIAEGWGQALDLSFSEHHARGGFAYAVRGDAFDPIM